MALQISSLNSGSNGNCFYIGNDEEAVLVDAGLSCRETEARMKRLDLEPKKLRAIFISHEHTDHVRGVAGLAAKHNIPVYVTEATRRGCYHLDPKHAVCFKAGETLSVGNLSITAFPKFHDAADPHSFTISAAGVTVGVFTDLGRVCEELVRHFSLCHAAFLETNYDEEMLHNGRYPHFLKNRIRGGHGHLSNREALELFAQHRAGFMTHLFPSHLSADNNCPDLVRRLFAEKAGAVKVIVAGRHAETPVYTITAGEKVNVEIRKKMLVASTQMSLF